MSEKITCPFCLAVIPVKTQVCRHCGRDVGQLIRAEARIAELEACIANGDRKKTDPSRRKVWSTTIPILSFYAISVFSVIVLQLSNPYNDYVLFALAVAVGAVIVGLRKDPNLWKLFLVGFTQPLVVIMALLFLWDAELWIIIEFARDFLNLAFKLGVAVFAGGLVQSLVLEFLNKRRMSMELFSLAPLFDWVGGPQWNLDRIRMFLAAVGSLITVALILAEKLQLLE